MRPGSWIAVGLRRGAADLQDDLGVLGTGRGRGEGSIAPPLGRRAGDHGLVLGQDATAAGFPSISTTTSPGFRPPAPWAATPVMTSWPSTQSHPNGGNDVCVGRAGPVNAAVTVVQRGDQAAQRLEEGAFVGVLCRPGQCPAQLGRPVGVDDVEVGIEVLEDVPGEGDRGQPGGAVVAAGLEAGRAGCDQRNGLA